MIYDFICCNQPIDIPDGSTEPDDSCPDGEETPDGEVIEIIEHHQPEGQSRDRRKTYMPVPLPPDLLYDHADAVDGSPEDEVPTRAMPETSEDLCDERIEVRCP